MSITSSSFGNLKNGIRVKCFKMKNTCGMEVHILDYGATIQRLIVPDKNGGHQDVVMGFDTVDDYIDASVNPYAGAVIGRYAGRIPNGAFSVAGRSYQSSLNIKDATLHGGNEGFDKKIWSVKAQGRGQGHSLELKLGYKAAEGEEGFPSNLDAEVTFSLALEKNVLTLSYHATTTGATVCNMTHHDYFNLNGHNAGSIFSHVLHFNTDKYFPMKSNLTPIGLPAPVDGTPFDFRTPQSLGAAMGDKSDAQLVIGNGFDHSFLNIRSPNFVAVAPESGIKLEVFTTQYVTHLYTGNFVDSKGRGKDATGYKQHSVFALECQNVPNGLNNQDAPSSLVTPTNPYSHSTTYVFSVV